MRLPALAGAFLILALPGAAAAAPASVTTVPIPTPAAGPSGVAAAGDGSIWFTEAATGKIGRVSPAGQVTEFRLPSTKSRPTAIVAGPDGNLWFTEANDTKVGRITPEGAISEFAVPSATPPDPNSPGELHGPADITRGPDGALWFTEPAQAKLGRVTTAGSVSEVGLPAGSKPTGIATGSDGNLWVTLRGPSWVARVTPAGSFTAFGALAPVSGPITAGPDGNLYFPDNGAGSIARITTSGAITRLPLPKPPSGQDPEVAGLTAAGDGNIWFTDQNDDVVGRLTPDGAVTYFPLFAAGPLGIAAGPGGTIWFTELEAGVLGRLPTGGSPVPAPVLAGPRIKPKTARPTSALRFSFRTPPIFPQPDPFLPGDDPAGAPDGGSYLYLSVNVNTLQKHCTNFDDYAIVPSRRSFGVAAHKIVNRAAGRPGARVTVTLRPGRGRTARWCFGRYKLDLSVSYFTAPGPGSEAIVLEEYPLTRVRIR